MKPRTSCLPIIAGTCLQVAVALAFASVAGSASAREPDHPSANLVCTSDGKDVRAGGNAILDHDVTCSIAVVDDRGIQIDAAQVSVTVALPFGSSAPVVQSANQDGSRWTAAAFTSGTHFLRCEVTTFAAELRAHGDVVWSGTLTVRPACPHPRIAPTITCATAMHDLYDDLGGPRPPADDPLGGPPPEQHEVLRCTITVRHAPAVQLRGVIVRAAPSHRTLDLPASFGLADAGHGTAGGHGDLELAPASEGAGTRCPPTRVDAIVWTADGAILWSGHASADVGCR
jgi:hypothetical protein